MWDLTPEECRRRGGVPQGAGTDCSTTDCRNAAYDYGDAPDPQYPTLQANNGASHFVDNLVYLGQKIDAEVDGLPNATATGDDNDNLDDEDGVVFTSPLNPGSNATVDVEASNFGILSAWLDFNSDGDWSDAGEQIFTNQPLIAGITSLNFAVPANAIPGNTFSRFRFSSVVGLSYQGQAINGEIEDHLVRIEHEYEQANEYYKWQQPPLPYDPSADSPVFCGWDQPAYVGLQGSYPNNYTPQTDWNFVADDFRCFGSMPITSIHWWGSYVNWTQKNAPSSRPTGWIFGFWTNVAANVDAHYSHPGALLKSDYVSAEQVQEVWAGQDRFPGQPADTCYKYSMQLKSNQYFWQERYLDSTDDRVYWLSITAVYTNTYAPSYPWGWKTRPAHWMDDAVTFKTRASNIGSGWSPPSVSQITPIESSAICHQAESFDVCFALDTDPDYVKWNQPFTGLKDWAYYQDQVSIASGNAASSIALKWEQPPDLTKTGIDVDATWDTPPTWPALVLADDFQCTQSGPITEIELWGSWFADILVGGDANNVRFTLNIHQDIPAHLSHTNYSQPGDVLWSQTFWPGDFSVWKQNADVESFYHPYSNWYIPNNHWDVYKYKIPINNQKAFHQTGTTQTPVVYWLSVQAYLVHQPGTRATRWGWKTSTKEWNDVPVYANTTDPNNADWKALSYPNQHAYYGRKPGLAFRVTTSDKSEDLTVHYQVADDWLCDSRNPITATTWWGSYVGYNYNVCACQEQPTPQKPLYFWLSIWTDIPDPWPADVTTFSKPSKLVWEYQAYDYDEVLVGFDNAPQDPSYTVKHEAVYRYSMRFPKKYWFYQPAAKQVYWFSVVAVYPDLTTIPYKWGWTNHKHVYNDNAVTSLFPYNPPTWDNIFWSPLYDRISAKEDMSFMLYTDPNEYPND